MEGVCDGSLLVSSVFIGVVMKMKGAERSGSSYMQRTLNEIFSRLLIRNFGGQKAVSLYIQGAKSKKSK